MHSNDKKTSDNHIYGDIYPPAVPPPASSHKVKELPHPTPTDAECAADESEWTDDVPCDTDECEVSATEEAAEPSEEEAAEPDEEEAPAPTLTAEEIYRAELERARLEHEMEIAENVQRAKSPDVYDTYEASEQDGIRIFAARRRGRSHIMTGAPCQDYCASATTKRGIILTDADGVGSCERSDVGSRIACEVTIAFIKETDAACDNEETLVMRLLSPKFREILVKRWLKAVLAHLAQNPTESDKTYELYASTLMFALITDNYYIVGNLGDGQILLFNEAEGLKLRRHPRKTSTKVRALVHPNCYREDFIVEKFSRRDFSAVLLSTDGMYDVLSNGGIFHEYALQIKDRFLESSEPLQPFCFKEEGEPFKDIFSHRTHDDCSIVLACDTAADCKDGIEIYREVRRKYAITLPEAIRDGVRVYISEGEDGRLYRTVVSPAKEMPDLRSLRAVRIEMPVLSYSLDGLCYRTYLCDGKNTLVEEHHGGALREQSEYEPLSSLSVLERYDALCECETRLADGGYRLTKNADCLALYDGEKGRLCLYPEAICREDGENAGLSTRLFASLYGRLTAGKRDIPIFSLGFLSKGQRIYLSEDTDGPRTCICLAKPQGYALQNKGEGCWRTDEGIYAPGDIMPLKDGVSFVAELAEGGLLKCEFKALN